MDRRELAPVHGESLSPGEALTRNFYAWERRGRGWQVWDDPVALEPPFRPFFHAAGLPTRAPDDGRRPGVLELLSGLFGRNDRSVEAEPESKVAPAELLEEPLPWSAEAGSSDLVELKVTLPAETEITREAAEHLLLALSSASEPLSFELVGTGRHATLQLAVRREDLSTTRQAIEGYCWEAVTTEREGALKDWWNAHRFQPAAIVDFGLSREFMLPLRTPNTFSIDPLTGFLGVLEALDATELGLVQVLFARTTYPWTESILRAVSDGEGRAFFGDAPEMLSFARAKVERPLFACVIRVAASAANRERAVQIVRALGSALRQLADPTANELIALSNDGYDEEAHALDVVERRSRRTGMLLSVEELASLVHLPSASVRSPGLRSSPRTTKRAPASAAEGDAFLGENVHRGERVEVRLRNEVRLRHTYVIGATGTGKSTLLLSLLRQDIEAGRGVGLIDPHGDLADEVLRSIPEARHKDVVLFDPGDVEQPVGFNILQARSEREKELLSSDLVSIFRRFSTSWGDQMTAILGNAILAILESERGGTLVDLRRFLVDRSFREKFLLGVRDPSVVSFWKRDFPLFRGQPQVPLLTRLDAFLRPKSIRMVVAQKESKLDLASIMDQGKIFIARLSQGAIGEENAHLLGSLLVSKFQQMALARDGTAKETRRDFFLYLDEFHHFRAPSLGSLLSGARKYHLGLVLDHQDLRQLADRELESAVLTNPATRVCFRLGDEDARKLSDGFASFSPKDLQSLGVGEAVCRMERADQDFNLAVNRGLPIPHEVGDERRRAIKSLSRARYGTPRSDVEAALAQSETREEAPEVDRGSPEKPRTHDLPTFTVDSARNGRAGAAPVSGPPPQPPARDVVRIERPMVQGDPLPGRGGAQHKYLRSLIKQYAEERGFRATLEAPVEAGGRIDVLLEREGASIACEISIGSSTAQELGNLAKCLGASHTCIIVVSPERRVLKRIEEAAKGALPEEGRARVSFLTPEELLAFLDGLGSVAPSSDATVLGYRVKTNLRLIGPEEQNSRRASIIRTILESLKRLKGPPSGG
jgi:hypothetical protein